MAGLGLRELAFLRFVGALHAFQDRAKLDTAPSCSLLAAVQLRQQAMKGKAGLLHTWLSPGQGQALTVSLCWRKFVAHASWMWHCEMLSGGCCLLSAVWLI